MSLRTDTDFVAVRFSIRELLPLDRYFKVLWFYEHYKILPEELESFRFFPVLQHPLMLPGHGYFALGMKE